ncbi:hypothetical protein JAAARDRAFT_491603 [Jaapia argillacea MUCL 33604]|uniref:Uncharacterized protein n=1 Tax=Jaapia argillacea MUCL 33604 TaxID=933084 RepID=A0A067PBN6_9AGAM|nr:hypothetical protein JAAARDRAFT_491603 [Jaapia argillacea MUCL 33604]
MHYTASSQGSTPRSTKCPRGKHSSVKKATTGSNKEGCVRESKRELGYRASRWGGGGIKKTLQGQECKSVQQSGAENTNITDVNCSTLFYFAFGHEKSLVKSVQSIQSTEVMSRKAAVTPPIMMLPPTYLLAAPLFLGLPLPLLPPLGAA